MSLETLSLPIILGITNLLLAFFLGLHYRKNEAQKGFGWWITGILLTSFYFFFQHFEHIWPQGILIGFTANLLLVASMLALYKGVLKYFSKIEREKNFLIFSFLYLFFSTIFFIIKFVPGQAVLSAFSIVVFSILIARLMYLDQSSVSKKITRILSITFLLHAIFFFLYGVHSLIPQGVFPDKLNTLFVNLPNFVTIINITVWTAGFIILINVHSTKFSTEAKEIFELTFNTIPDAVLITRLEDGLILQVNPGFSKLTGHSAQEVVGKTTLEIDAWENPDERKNFYVILSKTGVINEMEFQFRRKNGKLLLGLVSARTIKLEGEVCILSIIRDVTARKKIEDKLRENEEKYRFLAENSGDVIWHINTGYRIDYISPVDETLRGFKREEVIGQPIWNMFKPEGIKLVREKIEHHLEVEQVGNNMNVTRFEIEQRCKNGDWIWTDITAAPHYDKRNVLIGYHGISRDISEKKQLLDQLHRQATTDELTQIPNRRHFLTLSEKEMKRAKRYHHPLSLVLIDFDNLKVINDTYGHLAGDRALSVFSKIVQTLVRDIDILGRFGGDEFLILLPETEEEQAMYVMERVRQVLTASPIIYQKEQFSLSISCGIASINEWTDTLEDLIKRADKALYQSKESGGNTISTFLS